MSVRVKICGVTRVEDAVAAAALAVDAVGVVLWARSPRAVTLEQAAAIGRALPPWTARVGVFVTPSMAEVEHAIAAAGLSAVQIHGAADPAPYRGLHVPVVWAESLRPDGPLPAAPEGMTLLLDAHDPARHGGTGRTIDWARARAVAARGRRLVLAGGLHAENVARAIAEVQPWGVDVSSGVESAPGLKSAPRMQAFVAAVRGIPTTVPV